VNIESVKCLTQVIKEDKLNTRLVVFGELAEFESASLTSILRSRDAAAIDKFECARLTSPDQVATIVCSFGTSGLPKGTKISHASMINYMNHVRIHDLRGHVSMWTPSTVDTAACSSSLKLSWIA
jgi:long-subunit acyl-CoA synthetase (AMP-forming)